ncbi:MAG TPA: hypothetical protein VH107_19260 [Lacipirellulaceae bacterium]|nr:hypothetical protein [Lacipirellulaceae bacterium]
MAVTLNLRQIVFTPRESRLRIASYVPHPFNAAPSVTLAADCPQLPHKHGYLADQSATQRLGIECALFDLLGVCCVVVPVTKTAIHLNPNN